MDSQVAFKYVEEDRVPDSMSKKLEDRSTCLPGYGLSVTASRNSKCFPMALFEEGKEYVYHDFALLVKRALPRHPTCLLLRHCCNYL